MKYEVTFAMCHCETVVVELDEEDVQGLSDDEIVELAEQEARDTIKRESEFDVDDLVDLCKIEE